MTIPMMAVALGAAAVIGTSAAWAQQRTEPTPAAVKADPAQASASEPRDEESLVDKVRAYIKEKRIAERLSPYNGVYPRIGGLTTGSGFAAGAGYRHHLFDDRLFVDLSGVASLKNYKELELQTRWLRALDERLELWTNFRYQDFPQEDFFGMGLGAPVDARTSYALESTDITTVALFHVRPWLRVGTDLGYFNPTIGSGTDKEFPSTEQLFTDGEAPGFLAQPDFLHNALFVEIDTRDHRGNPNRGTFYRASYSTWDDRTFDDFNFRRFDTEASHFIPVFGDSHVAALRAGLSFVNNADGDRVPFYFLPYIGGSNTVRGFQEFRFRDENILFLNAEYRWEPFRYVQIAPFFDAGEVRSDWADIGLSGLKTAYGIGFRVVDQSRTFFRVDIATGGGEGRQVFMKFRRAF